MAPLAFLLECAAIAAFTAVAASLSALGAFFLSMPLTKTWAPARRADLSFFLGTAPAMASVIVVVAAAAPSLMGALGLVVDHCPTHRHHVHLCLIHASGIRPLLAAIGAFSLALFLFRATALTQRILETRARLQALERLGARRDSDFPIVSVPGGAKLCHAAGVLRRRILISAELSRAMPRDQVDAALAHEEAHLRRRDPAAFLGFSAASLVAVPNIAQFFQARFHEAIEEACDAEAAERMGSRHLVAMALVNVAALQRQSAEPPEVVPAFGQTALERRVHLLLQEDALPVAPARAILFVSLVGALGMGLALLQAQELHHVVETLLHRLF